MTKPSKVIQSIFIGTLLSAIPMTLSSCGDSTKVVTILI